MSVGDRVIAVFSAGGWVMYPLLLLGLLSCTLIFERALFWLVQRGGSTKANAVAAHLRSGDLDAARRATREAAGVYGSAMRAIGCEDIGLDRKQMTEAGVLDAIERSRPALERSSVALSTIITAAPMLGILGTVTGIIKSFGLISQQASVRDPTAVAGGIAEALYTTAFGLLIAILTVFPYMLFRSAADRALSRLESIAGLAVEASRPKALSSSASSPATTVSGSDR